MSKKNDKATSTATDREKGAAFIAWYKQTMEQDGFKQGMILRSQAAFVLGISQNAVDRLIARGYIRARHFPKEPDVENVSVGPEDPFYARLILAFDDAVMGAKDIEWYQACYVSLQDVIAVWETNEQKDKSRINWQRILRRTDEPLSYGPHWQEPGEKDKSGSNEHKDGEAK